MKTLIVLLLSGVLIAPSLAVADALKDKMIDHQQKSTAEEMEANEKATPAKEMRPAATSKSKIRPPAEAAKDPVIVKQKEDAAKAAAELKAATPESETRPAVSTQYK